MLRGVFQFLLENKNEALTMTCFLENGFSHNFLLDTEQRCFETVDAFKVYSEYFISETLICIFTKKTCSKPKEACHKNCFGSSPIQRRFTYNDKTQFFRKNKRCR